MNMKLFLEEKYQDWLQKLTLIDLKEKEVAKIAMRTKYWEIKKLKYFSVQKTLILWFLKLKCRTF